MLQFKHRDKILSSVPALEVNNRLPHKVWSLLLVDSSRYQEGSLSKSPSSRSKQTLSLASHAIYGGRTILRFSFISWFPSPIPDLYEVAPSSTLLPILCLPPTLEVFRVAPIHSLLPIHCLPPSLTSTRVLIGRVSSDQVSLFLVLV